MSKIFICHSWEDRKIVRKLTAYLKRDGVDIWIANGNIACGSTLAKAIGDALTMCDIFLLIWSKTAAISVWVEDEWTAAYSLKKRIIPCILNDFELPPILRGRLPVNLSEFASGYKNLCRALNITPFPLKNRVLETNIEIKAAQPSPIEKIVPAKIYKPKQIPAKFRSQPVQLSFEEVNTMLKELDFYDSDRNREGHGFEHQFKADIINGDNFVIDYSSGLMWQQGGSPNYMSFEKVKEWISELNLNVFAGFNNWRLPTLEEAMSLIVPEQKNDDLYIDSVFDNIQIWLWTSDLVKGEPMAWVVDFCGGLCYDLQFFNDSYVRLVCSV